MSGLTGIKPMLCSSVNMLLNTSVMLSVVDGLCQLQLDTVDGAAGQRWKRLRSSVVRLQKCVTALHSGHDAKVFAHTFHRREVQFDTFLKVLQRAKV